MLRSCEVFFDQSLREIELLNIEFMIFFLTFSYKPIFNNEIINQNYRFNAFIHFIIKASKEHDYVEPRHF